MSDGCRDYTVLLQTEGREELLKDTLGRARRFRSLEEAKAEVKIAVEIRLSVRIAADEACAGEPTRQPLFANILLSR